MYLKPARYLPHIQQQSRRFKRVIYNLTMFFCDRVLHIRTRTRQAIRAAGGKISLSFDYVICAEHTEHFLLTNTTAAADAAESEAVGKVAGEEGGEKVTAGAGEEAVAVGVISGAV